MPEASTKPTGSARERRMLEVQIALGGGRAGAENTRDVRRGPADL